MTAKGILLTAAGFSLLGLGAVGLALPVLPTTPFVLAASACFSVNPKVRAWLHKSKFFHEHYMNYTRRTGIKRITLIKSLSFLWGMLIISMIAMGKVWGYVLLSSVGAAVTVHLVMMAKPKK